MSIEGNHAGLDPDQKAAMELLLQDIDINHPGREEVIKYATEAIRTRLDREGKPIGDLGVFVTELKETAQELVTEEVATGNAKRLQQEEHELYKNEKDLQRGA